MTNRNPVGARAAKGSPHDEPCGWLGEGDVVLLHKEAEFRSVTMKWRAVMITPGRLAGVISVCEKLTGLRAAEQGGMRTHLGNS